HNTGIPREIEVLLALAAIVVLSPVLVCAALLVALTSGFPIVFRQERVGLQGRRFWLLKLRTMRRSGAGPQVTATRDTRITPVGKLLRNLKIDEIPQLWNVVRGDVSLVGPRPEVPRYVDASNELWIEV